MMLKKIGLDESMWCVANDGKEAVHLVAARVEKTTAAATATATATTTTTATAKAELQPFDLVCYVAVCCCCHCCCCVAFVAVCMLLWSFVVLSCGFAVLCLHSFLCVCRC